MLSLLYCGYLPERGENKVGPIELNRLALLSSINMADTKEGEKEKKRKRKLRERFERKQQV